MNTSGSVAYFVLRSGKYENGVFTLATSGVILVFRFPAYGILNSVSISAEQRTKPDSINVLWFAWKFLHLSITTFVSKN